MTKGRVIGVLALVAALIVGVLWWRGRGGDKPAATAGPTTGSAGVKVQRGGADPTTGVPRWFGATGLSGRRIAGIVVGEDGAPVAGATVRLAGAHINAGLVPAPSKVTDAAGTFDFGAQPPTTYVVSAQQPKLTGALLRVDLRDPTAVPAADQLRLILHACDAAIHGTIYDSAGGIIAGAMVARAEAGLLTQLGVAADDTGTYELCVPAGGTGVSVTADGYAGIAERIDVYGRTRRDFRLVPGTSIAGRVIRADNQAPVADAIVELRSADPREEAAPQSTSSDADGTFHFDAVAPGRHMITARAERLATKQSIDVVAELGAPATDVVCELEATYSVSGRVVDAVSKKPVAGRTLSLRPRTRAPMDKRPESAVTQLDGSFAVDHVLPGEYIAAIGRTPDKQPATIKVEAADVTDVLLEIDPGASISGRVTAGGKPVDGALVRAGGQSFMTSSSSDPEGRFVLRGLAEGTYQVYAESHLVGAFTQGPSVTVAAGEQKSGVEVELDLSASISGVVVDQNDQPVGGAFLSFSLLGGRDFGSATTSDDGTFTARSMSGGGDYVYEVRQRDGSPIVYAPAAGKRFPPITVKDGATHVTGLRIKVRYERLAIGGRVTDSAGKPVADARVTATQHDEQWGRVPSATTDETGAFTIRDLTTGSYFVRARGVRGEAYVADVAAGRMDVALRIAPLGGVDGTLQAFKATPDVVAYRVDERFSRYRATVTGSTFQLRNLPAGEYQVTATAGLDRDSKRFMLAAGETTQLTLAAREVGTIAGTVVDEKTRAPVAGLSCMATREGQDSFDFEQRQNVKTDANGAFRIERATVGENRVGCFGDGIATWGEATVTAGQVARVELTAVKREDRAPRGTRDIGMTLEDQLGEVLVKTVTPGGPAARAGIVVRDALISIDGDKLGQYDGEDAQRRMQYSQSNELKLVLERNDKELAVVLKLDPSATTGEPRTP